MIDPIMEFEYMLITIDDIKQIRNRINLLISGRLSHQIFSFIIDFFIYFVGLMNTIIFLPSNFGKFSATPYVSNLAINFSSVNCPCSW